MNIIPAIDLKDGKCVRLFKGDFEQTTEYSNDPAAIARRFSNLNVEQLHVVDLDGARSGESVLTSSAGLKLESLAALSAASR
jgi:phosphoribosylformimino-5-aminoimidazole carboxamide ribotide isomerase